MKPFRYVRPLTLEAAVAEYMAAGSGARYLAGGTTLFDLMKLGIEQPTVVVDLTHLKELETFSLDGDRLRFGGLAKMAAIAAHPELQRAYPVLTEAMSKAASQQLRNMATAGGNLLQRTRCMYFRNGSGSVSTVGVYPCNKRQPGAGCAAIGGLDRGHAVLGTNAACTAVSPGDWPVALTALNASVELYGPQGQRTLPIEQFYLHEEARPDIDAVIMPGEIILCITVPKTPAGRSSTYLKVRDRESYAFALASAAVALDLHDKHIRRAHIALGGVATKPWRAHHAEDFLKGRRLTKDMAVQAGLLAMQGARPGMANGFKVQLGAQTTTQALLIAAGGEG